VQLTRGGSSSNKDKQKVKVEAPDIETLRRRVEAVKDELDEWALHLRDIQPSTHPRVTEDQQELGEVSEA
jgi:hypothetical protein